MNAFLKAVHCFALCLALGGPLFWTCIWRVLDTPEGRRATLQVWQRVRFGIWLGAVCFLLSGAADLLRAAYQVIDPTDIDSAAQLADYYLARGLRGEAGRHYADVAEACKRAGREDKALDAYQRMAEIDPSNTSLLIALDSGDHRSLPVVGEKFLKNGDLDRAVEQVDGFVEAPIDTRDEQEALDFQFVSAGVIHGMTPFSQQNISCGNTDFELVTAENRRQAPRVSTRVPLVVISDTGGWREFTETVDVSEVGLKLLLAHHVAPTTVLRVSIHIAKWPETVARIAAMNAKRCIVRHCRQSPAKSNLVGVEFRCILEHTADAASPL